MSKLIYFDNSSTTIISPQAKNTYIKWLECYNSSTDSKIVKTAKEQIDSAKHYILNHCGVSAYTHTILFTSGGTESNCFIIRSCVEAFKRKLLKKNIILLPHIIVSAIEHHSITDCINDLVQTSQITATFIKPSIYGFINPADIQKEIKKETCLVIVMFANNEIPVINNLKEIGKVAHKFNIPVHSDAVQIFGKIKFDMAKNNIDSLSASAHKFYGPKGSGICIISNDFLKGYDMRAIINGTQQYNLRGGTENIPGILSLKTALENAFINRNKKNEHLFTLTNYLKEKLSEIFKIATVLNYPSFLNTISIIFLGPVDITETLPGTVLLSVCKQQGKPFCNVELKKYLDKNNIVVSIGSACNTNSEKSSHVLTALNLPPVIKKGVLRISFNDHNTKQEINKFINVFISGVKLQCADMVKDKKG